MEDAHRKRGTAASTSVPRSPINPLGTPMGNIAPITLVVGSDSLIGGALIAHLLRAGERVVGTTRRHEAVDESHLFLDLSQDLAKWWCPLPIAVAVVCAGVTSLDACRRDPVATAHINVQGVSALVKNLVARGSFVIYLGTNQVFDGSVPYRLPDDPVTPSVGGEFKDYSFTSRELPPFTKFQIKIDMVGTDQAQPPLIKELRAIALA